MCGFVSYEHITIKEFPEWTAALKDAPVLTDLLNSWPEYTAYPAFGGDTNKRIPILIEDNNTVKRVNAIWWFDASTRNTDMPSIMPVDSANNLTVLGSRTTFNARNLDSPFWKNALDCHRCMILGNQLGESKRVGKGKHQYLMQSAAPFLLGGVYRQLDNGDYCCAIITRDAHPKMTPYHDKAFPLFLPIDASFHKLWLGKSTADNPTITALLNSPKLFPTLHVQRVKTYKDKQVVGNISDVLLSDSKT